MSEFRTVDAIDRFSFNVGRLLGTTEALRASIAQDGSGYNSSTSNQSKSILPLVENAITRVNDAAREIGFLPAVPDVSTEAKS